MNGLLAAAPEWIDGEDRDVIQVTLLAVVSDGETKKLMTIKA